MFYAVYIHSTKKEPYAELIVSGAKDLETRNRDTLGRFVGDRVGIIRTSSSRPAELIGVATISGKSWKRADELDKLRHRTHIPAGSRYNNELGKWCYTLTEPVELIPHIPVKHLSTGAKTRSWVQLFPELKGAKL